MVMRRVRMAPQIGIITPDLFKSPYTENSIVDVNLKISPAAAAGNRQSPLTAFIIFG